MNTMTKMNTFTKKHLLILSMLFSVCAGFSQNSRSDTLSDGAMCLRQEAIEDNHISTFDYLDFKVFNNQKWNLLYLSHSLDVKVHWPDGHVTLGIAKHIEDLKAFFVWAPNTQIVEHEVGTFAGGSNSQNTGCVGVFTGTFTRPLPLGNGTFIQPTGKSFKIKFATIGIWNARGVMNEEYLFWDNQEFNRQLGI